MSQRAASPLVLALVAASAAVAACAPGPRDTASSPAPGLELPVLAGGTFDLAALRGKVVVLDFWATWCTPCVGEIPDYVEFWKRNRPRGVEVVGVVFDSGPPVEIEGFARAHRIPYPIALGTDEVLDAYDAWDGFPYTFVVDGEGRIVSRTLGSVPDKFERLQRAVDAALAAS